MSKFKRNNEAGTDDCRVFEDFTDFVKDRAFVTHRVALRISSYDNKGMKMQVETPNGNLVAQKGDVIIKYPNNVLNVMKAGHFFQLYKPHTKEAELDEAKEMRARVSEMVLNYCRAKGIKSFNKLEQLLVRWSQGKIPDYIPTYEKDEQETADNGKAEDAESPAAASNAG